MTASQVARLGLCGARIPFLLWGLLLTAPSVALAQIQVYDTFNFLDNRQASVLSDAESLISFGADVSPTAGTTVTASQGGTTFSVPYLNSPALPYQFFKSINYGTYPTLTAPWTLAIANPAYGPVTVQTSSLYSGAPTPFIQAPTTDGFSTTPTISWVQPSYSAAPGTTAYTSFFVMDASKNYSVILVATLPQSAVKYTVPSSFSGGQSLLDGGNYLISIQTTLRSSTTGAEVETSRSYFNFTPNATTPSFQGPIDLPDITKEGVFEFNSPVQAGVPLLLDPAVAVGYLFKVGAGDPLFESIALPALGNSKYEIELWNGSSWILAADVDPLSRYYFAGSGVSEFRVLGIDPAQLISPDNGTAFVSSVTFVADGTFTGSMTPITSVPEPASAVLLLLGLVALSQGRVRRR